MTEAAPEQERRVGEYRLRERLGEGGMGVVHRALDVRGQQVAIKLMRPHIAHDADARRRLAREVDILARVRDERVAAVLDADVEGERPYVVTEFVPGVPLDTLVDERGPLDARHLVSLGEGLAQALSAIHRAGIVHRDLKPGNVMMVGEYPVVIDFGIAQVADDVRLTMTGMVMGTPGYLSPELVEGGEVTEATDWWGWAACLAYAASGTPPFGRGPMAVVLDRVTRGRADLDGVDERLRPLLAAALAPDPRQRPGAREVIDALRAYAGHRPVTDVLRSRGPVAPSVVPGFQQPPSRAGARPGGEAASGVPGDGEGHGLSVVGGWPGGPSAPSDVPRTRAIPQQHTQVQPQRPAPQGPRDPYVAAGASVAPRPQPTQQPWSPAPQQGAYPAGPPDQGTAQPGYGPAQFAGQGSPDPRTGRPMRSGVLAAGLLLVVALIATAPWIGLGLHVAWSLVARTVDRAMSARVVRRHTNGGARRSDAAVSVAASPWHLLVAVVQTVLSLLLPLGLGGVTAVAAHVGLVAALGREPAWLLPAELALAGVVVGLMAWWGPGGTSLRRGSRSLVRVAAPSTTAARVLALLLLIAVAVAGLVLWTADLVPNWVPAAGPPWVGLGWWEAVRP